MQRAYNDRSNFSGLEEDQSGSHKAFSCWGFLEFETPWNCNWETDDPLNTQQLALPVQVLSPNGDFKNALLTAVHSGATHIGGVLTQAHTQRTRARTRNQKQDLLCSVLCCPVDLPSPACLRSITVQCVYGVDLFPARCYLV